MFHSALAAAPCTVATVETTPVLCEQFVAVAGTEDSRFYYGGDLDIAERHEILDGLIGDALLLDEARRRKLSGPTQAATLALLLRSEREALAGVPVAEAELASWFEAHHAEHDVPEKVRILHILIKSEGRGPAEAKRLAEQARAAVAAGGEFRDVAKVSSEDIYARRGGDIGFVGREGKAGVDPLIVSAAFAMAVGELSAVLGTAEGAEVLYVESRVEAEPFVFEENRATIERAVQALRMANAGTVLAARLRAAANVSIDEAKLGTLVIPEPEEMEDP